MPISGGFNHAQYRRQARQGAVLLHELRLERAARRPRRPAPALRELRQGAGYDVSGVLRGPLTELAGSRRSGLRRQTGRHDDQQRPPILKSSAFRRLTPPFPPAIFYMNN